MDLSVSNINKWKHSTYHRTGCKMLRTTQYIRLYKKLHSGYGAGHTRRQALFGTPRKTPRKNLVRFERNQEKSEKIQEKFKKKSGKIK